MIICDKVRCFKSRKQKHFDWQLFDESYEISSWRIRIESRRKEDVKAQAFGLGASVLNYRETKPRYHATRYSNRIEFFSMWYVNLSNWLHEYDSVNNDGKPKTYLSLDVILYRDIKKPTPHSHVASLWHQRISRS